MLSTIVLPSDAIVGPSRLANLYGYVGFSCVETGTRKKSRHHPAAESSVKVPIDSSFLQPETDLYTIVKCQVKPCSTDFEPIILLTYF